MKTTATINSVPCEIDFDQEEDQRKRGIPDEVIAFDRFMDVRKAFSLPKGMKYLGPGDVWQAGDEYLGNANQPWWKINPDWIGKPVFPAYFCYIPRGKR